MIDRSEPNAEDSRPDQDLEELSRDEQALGLRHQSLPYHEIASRLGWASKSSAFQAVQRALAREQQESPQQARAIMSAQLDEIVEVIRSIALADSSSPDLKLRAAKTLLATLDRKAKLLGLDVPMRRVVEVTEITAATLVAERKRVEDELRDSGFDTSLLPTAAEMQALFNSRLSRARGVADVVGGGATGGISLRRASDPPPQDDPTDGAA